MKKDYGKSLDYLINAYIVKDPYLKNTREDKCKIAFSIAYCFNKVNKFSDANYYF